MNIADHEFSVLKRWLAEGKSAAVAVVVNKRGSALRQVGAKMCINEAGEFSGSVSGGCVENAVIEESLTCIQSGQSKLLHYGIADDTAWSVGLMCGGEIDVFVQPIDSKSEKKINEDMIDTIIALDQTQRAFALLMFVSGDLAGQSYIVEYRDGKATGPAEDWFDPALHERIVEAMKSESSQIVETKKGEVFIDVHKPKPRLVVIGAVHIAISLIHTAHLMDYYTVLIDPRKAFAKADRFPDVDELLTDWPVEALEKIHLSPEDYVLLISHDDKLDLPAAGAAIKAGVGYIGMLASRTTRERRFKLLVEEGYSRNEVEKIHAPVGLAIGARTPEEISLSILAEITAFRYGKL